MNNSYAELKKKAKRLRVLGKSYGEIKNKIGVSKSTLSLWLKNIHLNQAQRKRLYTKQVKILLLGPNSQRERRIKKIERIIQDAKKEIPTPISYESRMLIGAALYWAEGSKTRMFDFANSDPRLILFIVRWIENIFKIPARELKIRLNIYPQQNENKVKKFWSDLTGIPLSNFGKSYIKPVTSGYKKNNLYYGTAKVSIPKSTDTIHRIYGWINVALKDIENDVKIAEKRWGNLRKIVRPVNIH